MKKLEQIDREGLERIPKLARSYMEYCLEDRKAYEVHKRCDFHCLRSNLSDELRCELKKQQERKTELVKQILAKALGKKLSESEDLIYYLSAAWGMQRGAVDAFFENRFEGAILEEEKYFNLVEQMFMGGIMEFGVIVSIALRVMEIS